MKSGIKKSGLIRIGNQTSFTAKSLILPFEYAVNNGFRAFEWFPDKKETGAGFTATEIDLKTRRYIRRTARTNDIRLSIHAPWWANPMNYEGRALLLKDLKFAHDLGATLLNIHLYTGEGINAYAMAISEIIEKTEEMGIKLSIENTTFTVPDDFNKLFTILRNQKHRTIKHVGMCLDLGHANLCDKTHNDYLSFVDRLDKEVPIIHVHLHENYGDEDSHLPVFTGPSGKDDAGLRNFIKRLKERNFSGAIILEQWPDPPSLLNQARDKLQSMFKAEDYWF
ncbi:MAG: sugar phosphate isomerase/epimerase family protein [bacterium]